MRPSIRIALFLPCLLVAMVAPVFGQCVGGTCYGPPKTTASPPSNSPSLSWRYAAADAHRRAVVRISTSDSGRTSSKGSGVAVDWRGRCVVLTAYHVVRDARQVTVRFSDGKTVGAAVMAVDSTWDLAILAPGEAFRGSAQMASGKAAVPVIGQRLETCGYGPDDRLAANVGTLQRFAQPQAQVSTTDWMIIGGYARGGDSGGPVFNTSGQVVGILWGSSGGTITAVQGGRIWRFLDDHCKWTAPQNCLLPRRPLVPVVRPPQANPTPPPMIVETQPPKQETPPEEPAKQPATPAELPTVAEPPRYTRWEKRLFPAAMVLVSMLGAIISFGAFGLVHTARGKK